MSGLVDLSPANLAIVERILSEHVPDCEVRAFGSRATWTAKDYSDLDLAVLGNGPLDRRTLGRLKEAFEESTLPMRVDVLDWHTVSEDFRRRIGQASVVLREQATPPEWRDVRLDDVIGVNPTRTLTRGTTSPFVAMADLPQFRRTIPEWRARDYKGTGARFRNGDTLLARITPCLENGKTAWVSGLPVTATGHGSTEFIVLSAIDGVSDPLFVYYMARSPRFRAFAIGHMTGTSGRQRVPTDAIESYEFSLPPLAKQREVAEVLGALDDKIELNRRMSETLDEMARALFRSWFVDFDPVRAKSEGRPSGLPPDLDALFPDSFEPSELDDIPAGWRLAALTECIDAVKGLSYKGSGLSTAGIPLHNLNSIYEGGGYKPDGIKFYVGDHRPRHLVESGDVVVANTDLTQKQVLIGSAAIVPSYHGSEGLFSHHLFRVRARDEAGLNSDYICHLLNSQPMQTVTSGYATGTTVNMLPVDALRIPKAVLPPRCLVARFGSISKALRARQDELHIQSCDLVTMRDTLLPRLLSGELRVRGAEQPPAPAPT